MDIVLKKQTGSICRAPPEDATSSLLSNTTTQITCYPILHHIMFIHHREKLKQRTQWMVHAGKTELQVPHYVLTNTAWCMLLHFDPLLCYSVYCIIKWNKKVKGFNKTKSCKQFWNAKYWDLHIEMVYSQHNYSRYMQLPNKNKKYDNYIYHWPWQILTATVLYSTHDIHKFSGEETVFWVLTST
jgi:hypothetical protein